MMLTTLSRFMFGTLRGRLILGVAAVHAVMMALFVGDLTARQRAMLLDYQLKEATAVSQALATTAAGWIAADDVSGLQELVEIQRRYPELLFAILADEEGRVLADTDKSRKGLYLLDLPRDARLATLFSSPALVDIAAPAMIGKRHVGWARVGISHQAADEKLAAITRNGIVYALGAILIGSVIAWFMGRRITRRLYAVQETIDAVRAGNRLARSTIAGADEAAAMAREFNSMLDAVAGRDVELRASEERYRSLIHKVQTAIVLHDGQGRILNSNPLAQEQLGLSADQLLGKPLIDPEWHFLREDGSILPVEEYPASLVLATRQPLRDHMTGIGRPDRTEVAWVLVNAEPEFDDAGEIALVIVSFVDVTERKRADEAIKKSEAQLNEAQRIAQIGSWELDIVNNVLTWSNEIYRMFEIDPREFGASYEAFLDAIHPDDREAIDSAYNNSLRTRTPYAIDHRLLFADGRIKHAHEQCETLYDADGKPLRSMGTVQDITERKLAEEALHRLNRELRAISSCNQVLVRAEDEETLLDDVCRIICDEAGYRMAWVGYSENDETKSIRPVAWAGTEDGYIEQARLTWADTELGRGPSGTALRTGNVDCIQDFATEPRAAPWRDSALRRGYRSNIALPLKDENANTFGSLHIYSTEPNAFTPDEIRLLEDLSADLAFGIMVLRARIERKRAEEALRARERELTESQRVARIGSWDWDATTDTIWWSDEYYRIYSLDSNVPTPSYGDHLKVYTPESRERLDAMVKRAMETGEAYELDLEMAEPAGPTRWICARGEVKRDSGGRICGLRGTAQDITERKQNEQSLALLNFALDNVHDTAFLIGEDGRFRYVNEESCRILGYSRDELLGRCVADVDPDFPMERWPGHWRDLKANGSLSLEGHLKAKDGRIIPVEITANYFEYDGQGYNLALVRDITERKRAEEELHEKERHSQSLLRLSRNLELAQTNMQVIDAARDEVREIIGYQSLWVYLFAEDKKHAYALLAGGTMSEAVMSEKGAATLTIEGDRMLEEIAEAKGIVVVEDARTDPRTDKEMVARMKNRTIVNVPIIFMDRHLGSVGTGTYGDEGVHPPTKSEEEYLSALASHLAVTLDRLHLLMERKQAEQERLAHLRFFENMDKVNRAIQGTRDLDSLMSDVLDEVLSIFDCDRAWLFYPCDPDAPSFRVPMEVTKPEYPGAKVLNVDVPMPPDMAENLREALESADPVIYTVGTEKPVNKVSAEQFGVKSQMMVALYPKSGKPWVFGLHQCSYPRVWTPEEERFLLETGRRFADSLSSLLAYRNLQESEKRLAEAQRIAKIGNWEWDVPNNKVWWSEEAYRIFETTPEEFGATFEAFVQAVHPDDRERVQTSIRHALQYDSGRWEIDYRIALADDTIRFVHEAAETVLNPDGMPLKRLGTVQDITQRKRAEEALYESQQVFRILVENSPDIIARYDRDCRRTYVNPVYLKTTQIPKEELLATSPLERSPMPEASASTLQGLLRRVLDSGVPESVDILWPKADYKDYWYNIYAFPEFDREGQVVSVMTISRDITERKRTEEEIQQLNLELDRRVKERTTQLEATNQELEAFAYSVSHDLRAPLRSIDGFGQALLEDYAEILDEEGKHYLHRVRAAAQRMAQLIDDLLSLSRVTRGEMRMEDVDLSGLAKEIACELAGREPERKVRVAIAPALTATGDARFLRVAIENLLGNAWKFTSKRSEATIEFGATQQEGHTVYFVRDNGAGFDMEYAGRLFGAFQRIHTSDEFPGTGIGLATVQRIIHRHGGRVWAESRVNEGATLYFTLPGAQWDNEDGAI